MNDLPRQQKDLRSYLRPMLKRWWLFALIVPAVTVGTYLYYDHKPKTYEAFSELYVQPSATRELVLGGAGEDKSSVENYALLIQTGAVARKAERILAEEGGKQGGEIPNGGISAVPIEKSSLIGIASRSDTPVGAARLANAYAQAFVQLRRGQTQHEAKQTARALEKELERVNRADAHAEAGEGGEAQVPQWRRREGLEQQIQSLRLIANQPGAGNVKQVEEAVPPFEPSGHDPTGNAVFAFFVGLLLAAGAAFLLENMNRRVSRVEDVEELYGAPILTEIPEVAAPAPSERAVAVMAKDLRAPFERLMANLDLIGRERPLRTILIASAAPEEGKSIVARNLAIAYREAGRNVALVDADFRKASIGPLLGVDDGLGLSDILAGRASFGQVVQEVAVGAAVNGNGSAPGHHTAEPPASPRRGGELAVVPAGGEEGSLSAAFASNEMRAMLSSAADAYGTVIVDSPPLLAVADALPLLSEADAVVVVTRLGVSTRDSASRLSGELERVPGVEVAGVVVNGVSPRVFKARSYGYHDG
ncbi:MAG TPA: hypothetical protein VMT37_12340 [Solirubrobacterales bacterium]|nr:hypothetical protein [Solirubrobacterales bacterium]